ncbi:MAG: FHA domain-containing protein [Clostridia bacterium]|nr:FHA domain-containing protein [Clostridia bacterium]
MSASLIPKLLSYVFVLIVYMFIIKIIQMVSRDIEVMRRRKSGEVFAKTYIKLLNLRQSLDFAVDENYALEGDVTIGRGARCEIFIDDPFLSQRHASFIWRNGVCYLQDAGSTNGTFLNGEKVEGDPIELLNGDKIELGQLSFIFVTEGKEK